MNIKIKNMNKFYWNLDTLEFFKELKNQNENEFYRKVNEFVKYECDLEENETYEDLQVDLINQINEL
jgi:Iap family predicted aminopeptidase